MLDPSDCRVVFLVEDGKLIRCEVNLIQRTVNGRPLPGDTESVSKMSPQNQAEYAMMLLAGRVTDIHWMVRAYLEAGGKL